jgi:hypothetical protein
MRTHLELPFTKRGVPKVSLEASYEIGVANRHRTHCRELHITTQEHRSMVKMREMHGPLRQDDQGHFETRPSIISEETVRSGK